MRKIGGMLGIVFGLVLAVCGAPMEDIMVRVPGFGPAYTADIYAGYIRSSSNTYMHYIFVESAKGRSNNDPITLWMNGQPGCSSKLGFLKQIGPYLLSQGIPYQIGDKLIMNPYSWHKASNLLFIDFPGFTGYSFTRSPSYNYTQKASAEQAFTGLLDFFMKFPEYRNNSFYLAGEYYAGRFVPEIALAINEYNLKNGTIKIGLRAVLVGGGVLDSGEGVQRGQIQNMVQRNFVDPTLLVYWEIACKTDPSSSSCLTFLQKYNQLISDINLHNIYGKCHKPSTSPIPIPIPMPTITYSNNYSHCQYPNNLNSYFQAHMYSFHTMSYQFTACNETIYSLYDRAGGAGLNSYVKLIRDTGVRVEFYGGDWDDLVPVGEIVRGIQGLGFRDGGIRFWVDKRNQHVGFKRGFSKEGKSIRLWVIKGAGHEVPQHKPELALQMFKAFLSDTF